MKIKSFIIVSILFLLFLFFPPFLQATHFRTVAQELTSITYDAPSDTITVTGFSSGIPCTFTDIYNADVAGGWGQISKQGDVQFYFNCRLKIGNEVIETWFKDVGKQVVFSDGLLAWNAQGLITIENKAYFTIGTLVNATDKSSKSGCSFISLESTYIPVLIRGDPTAEQIYVYSSQFNFPNHFGYAVRPQILNSRIWNCVLNKCGILNFGDAYNIIMSDGGFVDFPLTGATMDRLTVLYPGIQAVLFGGGTARNIVNRGASSWKTFVPESADWYAIDCELEDWTRTGAAFTVYRQYTFNLNVVDLTGDGISGANVIVFDKEGNEAFNVLTDAFGAIAEQTVSRGYYDQANGDTLQDYSPHTLTIAKLGYQTYTVNFTLAEKINWVIALQLLPDDTPALDHGFVHVSEEDKRFLVFDDGTPFYPVGINTGWWLDEEEAQFMKTHGINLARVWMSSWHINIEHPINGGFGLGTYDESEAQKLDAILDLAEQYDFYVQLVLLTFTDFAYEYGDHWNDTENNYAPSYFEANPYNTRFGGPCENPIDFFTDETARSYIKQRFNYILDRWGDNPRIAIWEFWNEVDLVGWGYPPQVTDEISKAWHEEMAPVFWENDSHHRPLTTSCRGDIFWNQTFMSDANDIIQIHTYNQTIPVNLPSQINDYITTMYTTSNNSKPVTIGEYGIDSGDKAEFLHNGLWSALSSGASGSSMYWYTNHEEISEEMWDRYLYFETFIRNIPWPFLHIKDGNATITGSIDTDVYSIQGDKFNLAWIHHKTSGTVSGAQLSFPNITNGHYTLSIYDDSTGTYLNQFSLNITAGFLTINLPDFSNHIAVKLVSTIERVELAPVDPHLTSPSGTYRWLDVANQLYGSYYRANYNYSQALVKVTFEKIGDDFNGTLIASKLKPNFGYQLKLVGTPGTDDNERIGLAGRWWQEEWTGTTWTNGQNLNDKGDGSSINPNDQTYLSRRYIQDSSSPTGYHYRYTGYLVFNYFITDSNGTATLQFETGSCYHVLWKTTQRSNSTNDGPVKTVTFTAASSQPAYDTDYPNNTISIFGEWERLPMGQVNLQLGEYNCQIILTEESFHGSGGTLAGNWAGAMIANIMFTIN